MDQLSFTQKIILFVILMCLINIMVAVINGNDGQNRSLFYGSGEVPINVLMYCTSFDGSNFSDCQEMISEYIDDFYDEFGHENDTLNINITTVDHLVNTKDTQELHEKYTPNKPKPKRDSVGRISSYPFSTYYREQHTDEKFTGKSLNPSDYRLSGLCKQYSTEPHVLDNKKLYYRHVEHFIGYADDYGHRPNSTDFIIFCGCGTVFINSPLITEITVSKYYDMLTPGGVLMVFPSSDIANRRNLLEGKFKTIRRGCFKKIAQRQKSAICSLM
jgi:hypothetical protein